MAYDPETTALLLVDPYNDFLSEGGKVWPRMQAIAEEVKLLDHLRAPVAPPREKGLPSGGSRSDATRGAIHKHGTTRLAAVAPRVQARTRRSWMAGTSPAMTNIL